MADPGEGYGGSGRLPLFLDQTETRRAEKKVLETAPPPYLRVWITAPPPPYLKVWNRHWVYLFTGGVVTKLSEI